MQNKNNQKQLTFFLPPLYVRDLSNIVLVLFLKYTLNLIGMADK